MERDTLSMTEAARYCHNHEGGAIANLDADKAYDRAQIGFLRQGQGKPSLHNVRPHNCCRAPCSCSFARWTLLHCRDLTPCFCSHQLRAVSVPDLAVHMLDAQDSTDVAMNIVACSLRARFIWLTPHEGLQFHLLVHVHVACQSRSCHHQSDEPPNEAALTGPPVARQAVSVKVARHLRLTARERAMRTYISRHDRCAHST